MNNVSLNCFFFDLVLVVGFSARESSATCLDADASEEYVAPSPGC